MTSSEADLDRVLALEPRNIDALVKKGDLRAAVADHRAATAFYKAALAAASGAGPAAATSKPAIDRALVGIRDAQQRFLDHLEQALTIAGFGPGSRPLRFELALNMMLGRAQANPKLQRPTGFYYPGIEERPFYDPTQFKWAAAIEMAAASILAELTAAESAEHFQFTPYLVGDAYRPRTDFHGLHDNPAWSTLQLWEKGQPAPLAEHFAATLAAIEATDVPRISVRAPNILFSKLAAGARIPPHHGMLNARLICHLPLIVPHGCGFRVGGETRKWEYGKLLIFDDTIEHEAWNNSSSDRVIVIFDVWHPDLDNRERSAISTMFEAIDSY